MLPDDTKIDLSNLDQASPEQVFVQCARHLLTQRKQSRRINLGSREETCAYRSEDGTLCCAAGCFISDSQYNPEFEHKSWEALYEGHVVPDNHMDLIQALQYIHDENPPEMWPRELIRMAVSHNFSLVTVQSFEGNI